MEIQDRNGVKVYSLCTGKALPSWLGERARRNLSKRSETVRRRIELLQDFDFPSTSTKVKQSPDGRFVVAIGMYQPSLKCYELDEMGMKFERRLDAEGVDFCFLGEDYGKMAVLTDDRSIQFHAPYGAHLNLRIPTFGRALCYDQVGCELMATSCVGDVYRINLEEGRFSESLTLGDTVSSSYKSVNGKVGTTCIDTSPTHRMTAVGGEDGLVRFWDSRAGTAPFVSLDVNKACAGYGFADANTTSDLSEVTSLAFSANGVNMAFGTKSGCVALYDIRSSKPTHIKEHQYGLPIHTVAFHPGSKSVMSADRKLIKVWRSEGSGFGFGGYGNESAGLFGGGSAGDDTNDSTDLPPSTSSVPSGGDVGSIICNIEAAGGFSHFCVSGDSSNPSGAGSGLVLCAGEQPRLQAFYAPTLGAAPRWCSFLDNITEELEERNLTADGADDASAATDSVYEDYKFITKAEVSQLGIDNLVGTSMLRGYMHGFFIDATLYSRVRSVANPFEYQDYRKRKIAEKLAEKQGSRIAPKAKIEAKGTGVNADLVERLNDKARKGSKKDGMLAKTMLNDDRFGGLFNNKDFAIDQSTEDFKLRNPSGVPDRKSGAGGYGNDDDDMDSDRDSDDDGGSDGEGNDEENKKKMKKSKKNDLVGFSKISDKWADDDSGSEDGEGFDGDEYGDDDSETEDGFRGSKVRGDKFEAMQALERDAKAAQKGKSNSKSKKEKEAEEKKSKRKGRKVEMFEADDYSEGNVLGALGDRDASEALAKRKREAEMDLSERLRQIKEDDEANATQRKFDKQGAVREYTYTPGGGGKEKDKGKEQKKGRETGGRERNKERRGVQSLRFKDDNGKR